MPWSGWFRLSSQDFRSWIRYAQKKTLWGGGGTRSQRIFFQLVQLGYGVMILLWSNKVWILLAQLLRFCREKDKCQNCLVARWLSWETHVLLKAASLLGLMVWVLDGTEISSGWVLKKNLIAADEFYLNPVLLESDMDKGLCSREAFNAFVSKLHFFVKMGAVKVCFKTVEGTQGVFNKRSMIRGNLSRVTVWGV